MRALAYKAACPRCLHQQAMAVEAVHTGHVPACPRCGREMQVFATALASTSVDAHVDLRALR